jgi:hypothetical protein
MKNAVFIVNEVHEAMLSHGQRSSVAKMDVTSRSAFHFRRRLLPEPRLGVDMGKIGRTYPRDAALMPHSSSALAHFDKPFTAHEERAMRYEIIAAVIGLLCLLGFVAWLAATSAG